MLRFLKLKLPEISLVLLNKVIYYKDKKFRKNWKSGISSDTLQKVSIVTVNYNTLEFISLLLFSIFKNLDLERISEIVVIDNNSKDGSKELLSELDRLGMIKLIANKRQKYHGPAINQGIAYLNRKQSRQKAGCRYILILDSDVIILNRDVLNVAISSMQAHNAAVMGQFQYDESVTGDPHISSLLIDPEKVWNRNIHPFNSHGWPSRLFYRDVRRRNLTIHDFPFRKKNYLMHVGRGTLNHIASKQNVENKFYPWATKHSGHYIDRDQQRSLIFKEIKVLFYREVESITPENFIRLLTNDSDYSGRFSSITGTGPVK